MDNSTARVTIESTPSGILLPSWLQQVFLSDYDDNLLIIYPREAARQNSVRELSTANPSLDSSKHLTIKRLVRTLLTDFRQPNVFDDDSVLLYKTHQECVKRAQRETSPSCTSLGKIGALTRHADYCPCTKKFQCWQKYHAGILTREFENFVTL